MPSYGTPALAVIIMLLGVALGCETSRGTAGETLPPNHVRVIITTPQAERSCIVHVPAAVDGRMPLPLVIMLHGMGGTAMNALRETGWSAKADEQTFIVVYPEATRPDATKPPSLGRNPQAWNDGSGRFHAAERRVDDVAFLDAMIDRIAADHIVDPQRIFVAGFSNGASMAFRAGAELSHHVAAIAPHSGACWIEPPQPTRATSVCFIAGTADPLNPLEGGIPRFAFGGKDRGGPHKPAAQSFIDAWSRSLGCPKTPRLDEPVAGVRTRTYGPGDLQAEVAFITVEGLGHHWAGGVSQSPAFLVGAPTDRLEATDVVWEFFKAHPASDVVPRQQDATP